ncbi:MAG TPA: hypothetical protein VK588_16215 [Chitinophagaceae bacterium]|nr:hypothetical protein [Chitinophagaceae bacterium]
MSATKIYNLPGNRKIVLAIFLIFIACSSCKKGRDDIPVKKTEFKATILLSSGALVTINATGSNAQMGNSFFGGGTFVDGVNEKNDAVYTSSYTSSLQSITSPGTYSFSCEYRPDISSSTTPIYSNNSSNPGSITFTSINSNYMEGHFNAVCWSGVDSVTVTGSFKGDY